MKPSVAYTGFDKVKKLKQGADSLCYTYGYDHQRIFMDEHVGNRHRSKITGSTGVYAVVVTENGSNSPLPYKCSTSITKLLRYSIIYSRIAEKPFFDYFY